MPPIKQRRNAERNYYYNRIPPRHFNIGSIAVSSLKILPHSIPQALHSLLRHFHKSPMYLPRLFCFRSSWAGPSLSFLPEHIPRLDLSRLPCLWGRDQLQVLHIPGRPSSLAPLAFPALLAIPSPVPRHSLPLPACLVPHSVDKSAGGSAICPGRVFSPINWGISPHPVPKVCHFGHT